MSYAGITTDTRTCPDCSAAFTPRRSRQGNVSQARYCPPCLSARRSEGIPGEQHKQPRRELPAFALVVAKCRVCKTLIVWPGRCFGCATGRPISPEIATIRERHRAAAAGVGA